MMIARILIILLAFVTFSTPVQAGLWDKLSNRFVKPLNKKDTTVRLLVLHDKPGFLLEVKGKYRIYDPHTNSYIGTRFLGKRKYIQSVKDGLKWGEEFPGVYQILIVPDHETTTTLVDGIEYPGLIYIYDIGGTISVVNEVDYDDYLKAVLTGNFKEKIPEEAMAAYVITARTDAMFLSQNPKTNYWDVDAQQVGYQGHSLLSLSEDLAKSIESTHGMIMTNNPSSKQIIPFQAAWASVGNVNSSAQNARISFEEGVEMANKGAHAAQILQKAFPNSRIVYIAE